MALGIGPHTENAPPLSLPLSFFLTGLTGLVAALLVLLGNGTTLAAFLYQSTALLAATHLTTLGFVSLIMMGAMYQLVPVVLNTRLYSVRLGALHYALMVPGIGCLVAGFLTGITVFWLILGGSLIVVAVAVFLLNMVKTLSQGCWGISKRSCRFWYGSTATARTSGPARCRACETSCLKRGPGASAQPISPACSRQPLDSRPARSAS
jgi:hypothetical protein